MSRRTKLITLAIFVMLLGIPALYLALTWSPENPLRIRLLTAEELRHVPTTVPRYVTKLAPGESVIVLVENTSSVPLRLYGLSEGDRFPRDDGWGYGSYPPPSAKPTKEYISMVDSMPFMHIPPHSSLHFQILHLNRALPHPPEKVGCIYASHTKETFLTALDWCRRQVPTSLRFLIPDLQPDWLILPVHPPPPSATAP